MKIMIDTQYDLNEILESLEHAIKHIKKLIQEDKETEVLLKEINQS